MPIDNLILSRFTIVQDSEHTQAVSIACFAWMDAHLLQPLAAF